MSEKQTPLTAYDMLKPLTKASKRLYGEVRHLSLSDAAHAFDKYTAQLRQELEQVKAQRNVLSTLLRSYVDYFTGTLSPDFEKDALEILSSLEK